MAGRRRSVGRGPASAPKLKQHRILPRIRPDPSEPHDTVAKIVTWGLLLLIGTVLTWMGISTHGLPGMPHVSAPQPKPLIETGSVTKPESPKPSAADEQQQKRIEAACIALKAKEVAALVQQRQAAFNAYENCLVEYKPTWSTDPTPRQYCAPKLTEHLKRKQEVIDREAKTCTAAK